MTRHAATAKMSEGLFPSLESFVRNAVRLFETDGRARETLDALEHSQHQIRANSRHWLIG